jgi:trichohyalin
MADSSPASSPPPASEALPLPEVRLELRHGTAPPASFEMFDGGFLIGTAPGCDVRLPSAELPPVLCLITRTSGGVGIRKLVPTAPLQVNNKPVSQGFLADGDRVRIGAVELSVKVDVPPELQKFREKNGDALFPPAPFPVFRFTPQELEERAKQLDDRQKILDEQTAELETDRVIWYRRREEIEHECRQLKDQERELAAARSSLEKDRQVIQPEQERLAKQQAELQAKAEQLTAQEKELDAYRQQLDERYRERRDRLAGLQEAVNKAAANVQQRKRELENEILRASTNLQDHHARKAEIDRRDAEIERKIREFEEQRSAFMARQEELQKQLADRLAECQTRERQLVEDRQALDQNQAKYQADLVRLDRLAASLEQRQKEIEDRTAEVDRRFEELQQTNLEMESQALELKKLEKRLQEQMAEFAQQKAAVEAASAETAKRAAYVETQQATLAALRTRLEKQKDDLRREEQALLEQRNRREENEGEMHRRVQEIQRLRAKWEDEQRHHDQERQKIQERAAGMEAAVDRLRELEEKLTEEKLHLDQWSQELNAQAAKQAEEADVCEARAAQILQMEQKLADDRQSLRERETALIQAEQARETLQEQLRLRAEELAVRQRGLAEEADRCSQEAAELDARRNKIEQTHEETEQRLALLQQELDGRTAVLNQLQSDLTVREQTVADDIERLKTTAQNLEAAKQAFADLQSRWSAEQEKAASVAGRQQQELAAAREEVISLQSQLPELELQAREAVQKLTEARKQLREHLAELHTYADQAQEDLETLRAQVRLEAEQLGQQEKFLHKAREEQRLAVASFRQQLIEYQGQLSEMKRSLVQGETRLERRQAEVNQAALQIDATSARLAKQAEQIQEQERAVAERRDEMERHLADMREWYRQKLRELAAGRDEDRASDLASGVASAPREDGDAENANAAIRHILPMNEEIDEGDQKLGELLQSYGLVEGETLSQLLIEARKQRRSLRQMLLASGSVTLYQMAMIEAGNFDTLVLGPVRVLDRVRVTAQETVYRVFDPRRVRAHEPQALATGTSLSIGLLRHLTESAANQESWAEEFRASFTAAGKITHTNLASTWEVLDIQDRPAVLQEWLTGLPSSDWPSLASVPSVWFRLLRQTAQGIHAAHSAGLAHGHLQANRILLTSDGVVKIAGFGEPSWLSGSSSKSQNGNSKSEIRNPKQIQNPNSQNAEQADSGLLKVEISENNLPVAHQSIGNSNLEFVSDFGFRISDFASDVSDLCKIAAAWATPPAKKKGVRSKLFPKALRKILDRLKSEDAETCYSNANALLDDLAQATDHVPDNPEAWEKLLSHIRDQGKEDAPLKQSA